MLQLTTNLFYAYCEKEKELNIIRNKLMEDISAAVRKEGSVSFSEKQIPLNLVSYTDENDNVKIGYVSGITINSEEDPVAMVQIRETEDGKDTSVYIENIKEMDELFSYLMQLNS